MVWARDEKHDDMILLLLLLLPRTFWAAGMSTLGDFAFSAGDCPARLADLADLADLAQLVAACRSFRARSWELGAFRPGTARSPARSPARRLRDLLATSCCCGLQCRLGQNFLAPSQADRVGACNGISCSKMHGLFRKLSFALNKCTATQLVHAQETAHGHLRSSVLSPTQPHHGLAHCIANGLPPTSRAHVVAGGRAGRT